VEAVGSGVTSVRPGDKVAGVITGMSLDTGTIAEEITVAADTVAPLPTDVSTVDAAALGLAGITALDLLDALALTPRDTVLVTGATGGVGAFAVQLAAKTGATVLGTARPGPGTDAVRKLGAEPVDRTRDLPGQVEEVTAVVHLAGDPGEYAALLRPDGRLASALGATQEQVGRDDVTVTPVMASFTPEKLAGLLRQVADGTLQVPVARTYRLDDAPQAIADFNAEKLGKLVVTVH
jgi:NADPH:quinone reductase-like Zn-dependent oxidoreductase